MPCRQFNFLGDLLVLDDTGCTHASHRQHTAAAEQSHALYYRELPLDLIHETVARGCGLYMTLEFNWGEILDDVMQIERHPEPGREDYRFLHPILRLYRGAVEGEPTQVRQHHVVEDLFGTYRHDGSSAGTRVVPHSLHWCVRLLCGACCAVCWAVLCWKRNKPNQMSKKAQQQRAQRKNYNHKLAPHQPPFS